MNPIDLVKKLVDRVQKIEPKDDKEELTEEEYACMIEQYDRRMEHVLVGLRATRAKKTDAFGGKTYEDVWDNISGLELNYFKAKWLRISPEDRYRIKNNNTTTKGRIEDAEVEKLFSDYKKGKISYHKIFPPRL